MTKTLLRRYGWALLAAVVMAYGLTVARPNMIAYPCEGAGSIWCQIFWLCDCN